MRKPVLILLVLVVVIGGAWVWGKSSNSGSSSPQQVEAGKPQARKTAWDGSAKRVYDVTFLHGGQLIDLISIGYMGVNRPTGDVFVNLTTPKSGAALPKYIRPTAFHLVSPTGRVWLPELKSAPVLNKGAAYWTVSLRFRGVPSAFLGRDQIRLLIAKPSGHFEVDLIPPSPPAGHAFAEAPAVAKAHKPHKAKKAQRAPLCKKGQKSTKRHPCRH